MSEGEKDEEQSQGFILDHPYLSFFLSPVICIVLGSVLLMEGVIYLISGEEFWREEGTVGNFIFGRDEDES